MLFNSVEFLLFLPTVFLLYWFACRGKNSRNLLLIAASYLFYGWWSVRFLALIFAITTLSYFAGLYIDAVRRTALQKRIALAINTIACVGTLVVFKYYDFFALSFAELLRNLGMTADAVTLNLILPVGISFYTFQALSYTIDVYRGKIRATHDAGAYFVYISFFPQLVAGPIERAGNILPQFESHTRTFTYRNGVSGMQLILWGLFKKMVIADNAAIIVNDVFANYTTVGTINLWIGALLFTFQIYCDFSGYSDIAIGSARLFGIDLMRNFRLPYFARDIAEFWRRWHISLTTWFRDYIYIPLGGSRHGKLTTVRNTAVIFLVSGLWHGANYTFLLWGAYHAMLFIPLVITGRNRKHLEFDSSLSESLMMGITFLLVMIGWVIFRADNVHHALSYISLMFSSFTPAARIVGKTALSWILLLVIAEWSTRSVENPLQRVRPKHLKWAVCVVLFAVTAIFAGETQEFIYFKF